MRVVVTDVNDMKQEKFDSDIHNSGRELRKLEYKYYTKLRDKFRQNEERIEKVKKIKE